MSTLPSQADLVLEHMQVLGSITPIEALEDYGCFRLGARIWDLKRRGHNIASELVEGNDGKRFARYSLAGAE